MAWNARGDGALESWVDDDGKLVYFGAERLLSSFAVVSRRPIAVNGLLALVDGKLPLKIPRFSFE